MVMIGMVHPGSMGAAVGGLLVEVGHDVAWAGDGRSPATHDRATTAGLRDVATLAALTEADVVVSLCPPAAATQVAEAIAATGFVGTYVDANAVSPDTARSIVDHLAAAGAATVVDGSIVGGPPRPGDDVPTRLYLSGVGAPDVADLFDDEALEVVVLDGPVGAASALKMGFAGWTKAASALAVALRAMARADGVEAALLAEWDRSLPGMRVTERSGRAGPLAAKAWRFEGELREVAASLAAHDLPDGFHHAAADVYAALADLKDTPDPDMDDLMAQLLHGR